jgi:CheY-like chemotaxis protein
VALHCLIVDDNADFLQAARDLLDRDGLEVVALATTSDEAMASAARLRPDVILVDLYLANESGFDLAQRLTDAAGPVPYPILLISTYAQRDLEELVAASPAVGFLSKSELSGAAIRSALGLEDCQQG